MNNLVEDMVVAYSQDCIDYVKQMFNKNLDYSEKSIEEVEFILNYLNGTLPKNIFQKITKQTVKEENIAQMSKMFGSYLGEVIRKIKGGIWKNESKINGQNTLALVINDTEIYPLARVYHRIKGGKENNVYDYFKNIINDKNI